MISQTDERISLHLPHCSFFKKKSVHVLSSVILQKHKWFSIFKKVIFISMNSLISPIPLRCKDAWKVVYCCTVPLSSQCSPLFSVAAPSAGHGRCCWNCEPSKTSWAKQHCNKGQQRQASITLKRMRHWYRGIWGIKQICNEDRLRTMMKRWGFLFTVSAPFNIFKVNSDAL